MADSVLAPEEVSTGPCHALTPALELVQLQSGRRDVGTGDSCPAAFYDFSLHLFAALKFSGLEYPEQKLAMGFSGLKYYQRAFADARALQAFWVTGEFITGRS